jgi:hypothetical protein
LVRLAKSSATRAGAAGVAFAAVGGCFAVAAAVVTAAAAAAQAPAGAAGTPASRERRPVFQDRASETGLDWTYFNGMSGELYMVEMVGGGAALLDFDNDGDLDVFVAQGTMLGPGRTLERSRLPPPRAPGDRLFRNDLDPGRGPKSLRFTDVTESAGIREDDYGQGVATGDIDNDGFVDLFVTNYGSNRLWRNRGDGSFERLPLPNENVARWSTGAAFFDFDRDGLLDVFFINYVDATMENHFNCRTDAGIVDYCGPLSFAPTTDVLLHNLGGGRFEDVSQRAGIESKKGPGLGVVAADLDADGWTDVYVANDQMPNFLWINQRDGTFRDDAVLAGCAVSGEGKAQAGMGVTSDDLDGDHDRDLFITHLRNETNTLYLNDGQGLFRDATRGSGLGPASLPYTGFGVSSIDVDNDGWLDLVIANGEVRIIEEQLRGGETLPLRQPNQLFMNSGGGVFEEARGEPALSVSLVSRGLASGDVDNDGDDDGVVINNAAPLQLLINEVGQDHAWLGIRAVEHGRDAIGARVSMELDDGRILSRWVHTDGSYLSAQDPRVRFGLSPGRRAVWVRIKWSDGTEEGWKAPEPGRYHELRRGTGAAAGKQE